MFGQALQNSNSPLSTAVATVEQPTLTRTNSSCKTDVCMPWCRMNCPAHTTSFVCWPRDLNNNTHHWYPDHLVTLKSQQIHCCSSNAATASLMILVTSVANSFNTGFLSAKQVQHISCEPCCLLFRLLGKHQHVSRRKKRGMVHLATGMPYPAAYQWQQVVLDVEVQSATLN